MKSLLFRAYLIYQSIFPINRGKAFLARLLHRFFGPFLTECKNGVLLELHINSSMDLAYLRDDSESFDVIESELMKLNEGDVFVDIGANIGYLTILASKRVGASGHVYSYEPSEREYSRLLRNLAVNKTSNVHASRLALSNFTGQVALWVSEEHTGLNRILSPGANVAGDVSVPVSRLDELLYLPEIKLIKIDVEGAEFLVLEGMTALFNRTAIDSIVVEITPDFLRRYGHTKAHIYEFMRNQGFEPQVNSDRWQYDEIFLNTCPRK